MMLAAATSAIDPSDSGSRFDARNAIASLIDSLLHPTPVLLMTELVIGLLILGTVAIAILPRLFPSTRLQMIELWARLKSWWIMVAIFILAVTIQWWLTLICAALLSFVALKEYFTLVHMRLADRRAILLAYLSIPVQYYWVSIKWYGMFIIFIPVYMLLIIPFRLVVAGETQRFTTSMGKIHWGLMAFVFGLSHLAALLMLEIREGVEADPRALAFYVVFLAEFNDVLQYLFGKTLGRHKLAPSVSPNKTWEGFLGGLVTTTLLAVLLRFLTPMDWLHALVAGALIGTVGPIGGLVISAIKRDVGVKDSGALIPGHGGVLDRVDSLCFSAPIFFHYVRHFYGA